MRPAVPAMHPAVPCLASMHASLPLLAVLGFFQLGFLPCHCCLQTAMRTEPLGLDRHCRRYWWLYCDPGFLFVEEPDGQRIGVITSKEQLDEVGARLAGWLAGPWVLAALLGAGGAGRQERWNSCGWWAAAVD